MILAKFEHAAM